MNRLKSIHWDDPKPVAHIAINFDLPQLRADARRSAYVTCLLLAILVLPLTFIAGMSYGVQAPRSAQEAIQTQEQKTTQQKCEAIAKENAVLRNISINRLINQ
jgi:hypothetical protein